MNILKPDMSQWYMQVGREPWQARTCKGRPWYKQDHQRDHIHDLYCRSHTHLANLCGEFVTLHSAPLRPRQAPAAASHLLSTYRRDYV